MAFIKIEDATGNIELLVFQEPLAKYQDLWQEGKVIIVQGRLSLRNSEIKLICDAVKEIL